MINTKFWSDNFVVNNLNALDRYLFLYLLTNNHTNIIGIYELPLRTASFETGIEKDDLMSMLRRLSPKVEYFDGWVYIRNFADHQQRNPSIEKGMAREIFALPPEVIKKVLDLGIRSEMLSTAFDSLSKTMTESDSLSQPVTESDKPKLKPKLKPNGISPNGLVNPQAESRPKPTNLKQFLIKLMETLGHNSQAKPTDGRLRKLKVRLNTFKPEEVLKSATNLRADAYMQGDNEAGKKYGGIDYFLRSDEIVDKWLNIDSDQAKPDYKELLRNVTV